MFDTFLTPEFAQEFAGHLIVFILGIIATILTTLWLEKRKRSQITFSLKTETPLTLAKEELKDKLKISYAGTEIEMLYFSLLQIANTGKKSIKGQAFTCLFDDDVKSIDPGFPKVTTDPIREVGPIKEGQGIEKENEFRYIVELLGPGQSINIEFLTVRKTKNTSEIHNSSKFLNVIFAPNSNEEVKFTEGDISDIATLEEHIRKIVVSITIFYISTLLFATVLGKTFGVIFGLPFLIDGFRSLPHVAKAVARKLQSSNNQYQNSIIFDGNIDAGFFSTGRAAEVSVIANPEHKK